NKKQDTALAAQGAEGAQVIAKAAGELDGTETQDPRARVHGGPDIVDGDAGTTARHEPGLDSFRFQVQPWIDVGRILLGRRDNVVAFAPGKALRDNADALARVLD